MSILVNKSSRVIVQGITGSEGLFHTGQCLEYGTNIVGGVTPGKGGQKVLEDKIPVFNTCEEAVNNTQATVSMILVPPAFAADAIMEAAQAGIKIIVCISEGIPVKDMVEVRHFIRQHGAVLIGPNCPGILSPEEAKVGILPGFIAKKGNIGVISKSGTLTYEAIHQLCEVGLGQSTCVGIGGDPVIGTKMIDLLKLFEEDKETEGIVLIGEIGGQMEIEAAAYCQKHLSKPVIGYIAGLTAPAGKRMGHAGAIISGQNESAESKISKMKDYGILVANSPSEIGATMQKALSLKN